MNPRRRARVVLAVLVVLALALVTVDVRSDDGPVDGLRDVATSVLGPLQDGARTLVSPFGDGVDRVRDLFTAADEVERLRDRIDVLEDRATSIEDLRRENDELRGLLGYAEAGFDTVPARVIALGPSNYEWTVVLDVGTDDGVAEDMAVVDPAGLVGRVVLATPSTSRVLLAIDPNFAAATRVARTGEIGSVGGRGSELLLLDLVDPAARVEGGDEVVTSSYDFGVFPPGIPVGVVEGDPTDTPDLARSVRVRPYVDFTSLSEVAVVLTTPEDVPPDVPTVPDRDLDPPRLVPEETPTPTPEAEQPDDDADDAASALPAP